MLRTARSLGWGAGLLASVIFSVYALAPIDAIPGMRLGGTPTQPPASWADANDQNDIFSSG